MPAAEAATTCSIFIASRMATGWPSATASPSAISSEASTPVSGAGRGSVPSGPSAAALGASAAAAAGRAGASFISAMTAPAISLTQDVCTALRATSGRASRPARNGALVCTPAMRNSESARPARAMAAGKPGTAERTISFASRLSKRGLIFIPAKPWPSTRTPGPVGGS